MITGEKTANPSPSHYTKQLLVWWIAVRPYSFPAVVVPVLFGSAAAVVLAGVSFRPSPLLVALIAMIMLQAAANLWNDVIDFEQGLDRAPIAGSGAVVRRLISPKQARSAALILAVTGSLLGLLLAWTINLIIIPIGVMGVAIAVLYSLKRFSLKANALGDLAILISFGVLGTVGAWLVQAAPLSWRPVFWSMPVALLIVAILHANNWRDASSDQLSGITTVATLLSERCCRLYYCLLLFSPFILVTLFVCAPFFQAADLSLPAGALAVFLSLPLALKLIPKTAERSNRILVPEDLIVKTAKLNLLFGTLLILGLLI